MASDSHDPNSEDQGPQNSWDSLLGDLGIQPSSEVTQQPRPSRKPTPTASEAFDPENTELPKRPSSGWDSLLGELGLQDERSPQTPESPPAPAIEPTLSEDVAAEVQADLTEAETPADGGLPADEGLAAVVDQNAVSEPVGELESHEEDPSTEVEAYDPSNVKLDEEQAGDLEPRSTEHDTVIESAESLAEASNQASEPAEVETPTPEPPPQLPTGGFGGMAQRALPEWFPFAGRRPKTPPPPPAPAPETSAPESPTPETSETPSDEPLSEQASLNESSEASEAGGTTEGEAEGPPKRRRRRRGRRRGRGAKSEDANKGETTAEEASLESSEMANGDSADGQEDATDVIPRGRRRPSSQTRTRPNDDTDLENEEENEEFDEDGSDSSTSRGRRGSSSRNIPSWPETISVVVDANIAARSERKKASRNGSGRGRSRGRRGSKKTS